MRESLDGVFSAHSHSRADRDARVEQLLEALLPQGEGPVEMPDAASVPAEWREDFLQYSAPRTGFALSNAEIHVPGEGWTDVGMMRIVSMADSRSVGAWWVVQFGADGKEDGP